MQATNIGIFNNSVFSGVASASPFVIVDIVGAAVPTNLTVQNNLGFAPSNTNAGTTPVRGVPGTGFTASNNSASGTGAGSIRGANPNFAATPPTQNLHWRLTSGYAVNGGLTFPAGLRGMLLQLRSVPRISSTPPARVGGVLTPVRVAMCADCRPGPARLGWSGLGWSGGPRRSFTPPHPTH